MGAYGRTDGRTGYGKEERERERERKGQFGALCVRTACMYKKKSRRRRGLQSAFWKNEKGGGEEKEKERKGLLGLTLAVVIREMGGGNRTIDIMTFGLGAFNIGPHKVFFHDE